MLGGDRPKLLAVAEHRRRFASLFEQIAVPLVEGLPSDGAIVEIGAGDGQFTAVLPPDVRRRTLVTERMAYGVAEIRSRYPELRVEQAEAHQLPVGDGTVDAIVGCCVLDVLPNLPTSIAEFERVLRPGGEVLHILDMATDLRAMISEIVEASNLCLLPNVFTNPLATEWPDDLLVVPMAQIDAVIEALGADPAAYGLQQYRAAFRTSTQEAFIAFSALHESLQGRHGLSAAFRAAMARASASEKRRLRAFRGRPLSSARLFHERLLDAGWSRFVVRQAEIVRRVTTRMTAPGSSSGAARSIVGFSQSGQFAHHEEPSTELLELGVHVFRAVKKADARPDRDV